MREKRLKGHESGFSALHIFAGPSIPNSGIAPNAHVHPPVQKGDLDCLLKSEPVVALIIDGLFWHAPAIPHGEILRFLSSGHTVIGAASMGALRAVELRQFGMIGIGTIFSAYLDGKLTDDSEVGQAVSPFTFKGLTVPLVRIRRTLAMMQDSHAKVSHLYLSRALSIAQEIHFLERTSWMLSDRLEASLGKEFAAYLMSFVNDPRSDIKISDAENAIDLGTQLLENSHTKFQSKVLRLFL